MGTINLGNSLRYDMTGRKRKTKSLKTKKKCHTMSYEPLKTNSTQSNRIKEIEEHRKKYPSYKSKVDYTPQKDVSWKQEESKKFTVAPAYNKGAYQVIPRKEVKWIGK